MFVIPILSPCLSLLVLEIASLGVGFCLQRYHLHRFWPFGLITTDRLGAGGVGVGGGAVWEGGSDFCRGEKEDVISGTGCEWAATLSMIPSAMCVKTNPRSCDRVPASTFLTRPSRPAALDKTKDAAPRFVKWSHLNRKMLPLLSNYQPSRTRCRWGEAILPLLTRRR